MIHKLRRRFILIAMCSVSVVIVLVTLSINLINFASVHSSLQGMLEIISDNQGSIPDFPPGGPPNGFQDGRFTPETPYSTRYFVIRYGSDGELHNTDMRHIAAVTEDDVDRYLAIALKHGAGYGYTGSYLFYVEDTSETTHMATFLECQQELRTVRVFALVSVAVAAASILLVYVMVVFFSRRAMDPVIQSVEKHKQFITDASHELKTPLTVIATSLKVLEMEVGSQKWIDKAQAQAENMSHLVNDLVTLSRLDEEQPALPMAEFDISEAIAETADSFRDFAAAQGHGLALSIAPGLRYRGNEYAVRQLVSVLLDNAIKYADEGGGIELSLSPARRGVVLTATNRCADMDPAELDKLFDRFYRVEKSRSKQTGGYGVGLSIARGIAEAHRGSIRAECPDVDSVRFVVLLK